jgi:hypothetical protein
MTDVIKATPADAGCWIDGHWGQYGVSRMVDIATDYGYSDTEVIDLASRKMASMGPSTAPGLTDDDEESLSDAADSAESWLNDNVAPEGFSFGWFDGEFFLQSAAWWEDETY